MRPCARAERQWSDRRSTEHVKEAWTLARPPGIPPKGAVEILSQIASYASQLWCGGRCCEATAELGQLPDEPEELKVEKERATTRANANRQLRQRFLEVLQQEEPANAAGTGECISLPEANAVVVRPLLRLWDDLKDAQLESIAGAYDFWGRGNSEHMLLNTRSFPNSFNITLEVRSLDDVKRALRIWGLRPSSSQVSSALRTARR